MEGQDRGVNTAAAGRRDCFRAQPEREGRGYNGPSMSFQHNLYFYILTLKAESEQELKSLLMIVKEDSEKLGKTKIMASGPITSWEIDGETVETEADFILFGSKITADGECSHEIKTLTPWKESYNQPKQYIKKQRHYFANKVCLVKAMVFPVVMYGCESWTIKKAEH